MFCLETFLSPSFVTLFSEIRNKMAQFNMP